MFNVVLAHLDYFQDTVDVIETKLEFVSFDDKNLQRRRKFVNWPTWLSHTKLLYWSGSMSELQQGPEICDVISAKR